MSENNQEIENEEVKTTTTRRGRPPKIELPETTDNIESIEEVTDKDLQDGEDLGETSIVESLKDEQGEKQAISKPEPQSNKKHNCYTANYLYKCRDEVYLAHFSGRSDENIFGTIEERYIFRPFKTRVKEVLINEDNTISYRLDSCQGCFTEKLIASTLEECQKICDLKNLR